MHTSAGGWSHTKKPPPPVPPTKSIPFVLPAQPLPQTNEKGHPSAVTYAAIGDVKLARPKDFFDLQISPTYITNICKGMNYWASAEGDGIGMTGREKKDCGNFVLFDDSELYKFIGILFANGLNPWPAFETWFTSMPNRPLLGSNFVSSGIFDWVCIGGSNAQ
jgi:hypothetical protein